MLKQTFLPDDIYLFKQNFIAQFLANYASAETANGSSITGEALINWPIEQAERLANKAWKKYCETFQLI